MIADSSTRITIMRTSWYVAPDVRLLPTSTTLPSPRFRGRHSFSRQRFGMRPKPSLGQPRQTSTSGRYATVSSPPRQDEDERECQKANDDGRKQHKKSNLQDKPVPASGGAATPHVMD
jgi:hypothetical protein